MVDGGAALGKPPGYRNAHFISYVTPKHNKVSDDPGLYLVTLTKCLGELGVNCPRVSLPELEEMGTGRVLLVNWELLSDLVTPSNTFLLFGEKRGGTQTVAGMLG